MIRARYVFILIAVIIANLAVYMLMGPGAQPSASEIAAATPAAGEATTATAPAVAQNWIRRCDKEDTTYCEIFQRLVVKESKQRLIEVAIGYPAASKGVAQAAIILPLGIVMTDGVALRVDDRKPLKGAVHSCNTTGCYIYIDLKDKVIKTMQEGSKLTISFLDGQSKQINVQLSLGGFADKLRELRA